MDFTDADRHALAGLDAALVHSVFDALQAHTPLPASPLASVLVQAAARDMTPGVVGQQLPCDDEQVRDLVVRLYEEHLSCLQQPLKRSRIGLRTLVDAHWRLVYVSSTQTLDHVEDNPYIELSLKFSEGPESRFVCSYAEAMLLLEKLTDATNLQVDP